MAHVKGQHWELSIQRSYVDTTELNHWIFDTDILIDISRYRFPFEFVLERRGSNAVAKYGHIIAWRWLLDLGVKAERHHILLNSRGRTIRPDLFDPTTGTIYEVKTGVLCPSKVALNQAIGYQRAVKTSQARRVVYLDVAVQGRIGMSPGYRAMLNRCGHEFLFLVSRPIRVLITSLKMQIRQELRDSSVKEEVLSQLLQSRSRLRILDLLTRRPRSLRELSNLTGISIQGVLRHLSSLKKLGLVEERKIRAESLHVRKLYTLKGIRVDDFSSGDLAIIRAAPPSENPVTPRFSFEELENIAGELLVTRRVIKQRVRQLERMIDALSDQESELVQGIEALGLNEEEQLVLEVALTEDTIEEAERLLRTQGLKTSRELVQKVLQEGRRVAKK